MRGSGSSCYTCCQWSSTRINAGSCLVSDIYKQSGKPQSKPEPDCRSYRMIYAKHLTGQRNGMLLMSFFLMLLKPTYFSGSLANSHRFVPTITTREDTGYNLRERSYNLTLRQIDNNVHRKNFMYKMLFRHNYRVAQKAAIKNHH